MLKHTQRHSFHLLDPNSLPFFTAFAALFVTFGGVLTMHAYSFGPFLLKFGFELVVLYLAEWWSNIILESTLEGFHTKRVKTGLMYGMLLFIVSEIMFFFAFFFAFFYVSLNPSHAIGGVWPPFMFETLSTFGVPFLNTVILLTSGATITVVHESILGGSKFHAIRAFIATLILAVIFTFLQWQEYRTAPFTISDSIYGTTFFMATGFHGFHVLIGTTFIFVCFIRLYFDSLTVDRHFGFEAAAWYWHFVDVVWLFLFISIYWWGS